MGRLTSRQQGHTRPPSWATWLLNRFSPPGLEDELQGDLFEMYAYWVKTIGVRAARWRYGLAVFRLIRPFNWTIAQQSNDYSQPFILQPAMIRNYLKIAWRTILRSKVPAFINVTGLSIGLTCFLLIAFYILDELSYDRFHTHANRICRIDEHVKFGDLNYNGAHVPAVMGSTFAKDFKQIEQYTRLKSSPGIVIRKGDETIREDRVVYADASLFEVFSLEMIAGNKKTALIEPHSLVMTESTAKKYFTSVNIIGKTVLVNGNTTYKITGVIKDIPSQSHFQVDLFMPTCELADTQNPSWINYNFTTYLLLTPHTDAGAFEKQLNAAFQHYLSPQFKPVLNINEADFHKAGNFITCSLMPLTAIHLYSHLADELDINGDIAYVSIFSAIALFILAIACINFMNLSTAASANRAKEVGVRKVLGGLKKSLIVQFLTESLVACFLSVVLAIGIAALLLPLFNQLADKQIKVSILLNPSILGSILLLLILVSLLAGSYPAFYLSSFQPIKVLKGNLSLGFKGSALRNTLVVVQFTISIVLMIGTLVIYNQLHYIRNRDLGFTKEQVLVLQNTDALTTNTNAFTDELVRLPGVRQVTSTRFLPVTGARTTQGFITAPQFDGKHFTLMQAWPVDENYLPTFQIQLKSGRNFSARYPTDSTAVLINETAAKLFAGADPVGKKLYQLGNLSTGEVVAYHIIGVIKDFNFNSLHGQVDPLVLNLGRDLGSMAVRISTDDIPSLLTQLKAKWQSMKSSQPFSYVFLDEAFDNLYRVDQRLGTILFFFSLLAILIACLGLFGLVSFAAQQRLKEIGIRKVLGAQLTDIFTLLSSDFVRLILLSICLGSPIGWWAMNRWLENFAYRIQISGWLLVEVGAVCLLIALVTISLQVSQAAMANPVKSLRTD